MSSYFAPEFDVKIQGFSLEADVRGAVADLTVETSVETAGMATLRLHDPNLTLIDSALFGTGKAIDIQLGYANELQQVFVGEITAVQPDFPATGAPSLSITAYDKSHRMRHNSPARFTFTAMNDAAIVTRIALENQLIPVVVPSIMPPRESVQQTGSDWALLKDLADRNGYDVYVIGSELHFRPPLPADNLVVLRRGKNLSSFAPRLSTSEPVAVPNRAGLRPVARSGNCFRPVFGVFGFRLGWDRRASWKRGCGATEGHGAQDR